MGAKISRRGSYSLDKPEKKSKKKKKTKLTERAPSFISLSQAQIYEDEIKSPELFFNHKTSGQLYENQSTTAVANKQINEETGEFRKISSDHGIYSTSSDEDLYQNVFGEDGINHEEQLERKNTEPKVSLIQTHSDVSQVIKDKVVQNQEVRKRKSWSKQAEEKEEQYCGVEEQAPKLPVSESGASDEYIYSNTNWKEVLNGGFWKEEAAALEKASQANKNKEREAEQQAKERHREGSDDQILIENKMSPNSQPISEIQDQIEILDEDLRMRDKILDEQWQHAEINESNQTNTETYNIHAQLHSEHSHIIPADSIEKLRDMLQEQNSRASSTTPLQEIEEDEEEQVEIQNNVKPVPKERKRKKSQKVTFEDMKESEPSNKTSTEETETEWNDLNLSTSEEQMELPLGERHNTLSKSISVNSDMHYELANESWEDETGSEDQELFYDAMEFEGEDFQVEVPNSTSTKSELQTSTLNHTSGNSKTTNFALEEENVNKHEGLQTGQRNSAVDFEEENVGILIEFDEDTSTSLRQNPSGDLDESSKKRFSEQVEITDEFDNLLWEDRVTLANSSIINPTEAKQTLLELISDSQGTEINSHSKHDPRQSSESINAEKGGDFRILDKEEHEIREPKEFQLLPENTYDEDVKGNPMEFMVITDEGEESSSVKRHLIEEQLLLTEDTQPNTKNSNSDKGLHTENGNVIVQATSSSTLYEDEPIVANFGNKGTFNSDDEYTPRKAFEDHKNNFKESTALTGTTLGKDAAENRLYEGLLCEDPFAATASTEQEAKAKIGRTNGVEKTNFESNLNQIKRLNDSSEDDLSLQESDKKISTMFTTGQKIDDDISLSSSSKLVDLTGDSFEVSKFVGSENVKTKAEKIHNPEEDTMSYSISKPTNLSFLLDANLTTKESKSEKLQKGEFKPPSTITTPEEIAEEQMRVWGEEKDKQIEEVLAEINKIMVAIRDIRAQIDEFQLTETDSDKHSVMFQKLIKIMSEVNRVNNHNFNQSILNLQSTALNEVHECIRVLQLKKTN